MQSIDLYIEQLLVPIVEQNLRLHALLALPTLYAKVGEDLQRRHPYECARNERPSAKLKLKAKRLHDQHRNAPTYFESLQNRLRALCTQDHQESEYTVQNWYPQ